MQADPAKLVLLIEEGRLDEAKAFINELVRAPLSEKEKMALRVDLISKYVQAQNTLDSEYVKSLEEAVAALDEIGVQKGNINDKIELAEVREQLNNS